MAGKPTNITNEKADQLARLFAYSYLIRHGEYQR